ncbi:MULTISPECIES: TetR/AcrR family transcriptional regulator [Arthrobacter]|uniref:TetR/AcrR family transcriptional regulator n=1 Tax=Arthrobacter terricola TaxID=2547396 RepID=A0A4R5KBQ1_9MICC|nr:MULTISPECIES: TetR/AcrR family transcriptional regulator [Arthrobacter]MBT8161812.1 TetR/AcrR family transcriptional regulator [Arthrobacter sp. GN70]TDF92633.1 TetR/AcrR family transcriptional regulator [Arthrobacter terricola]
MALDAGDGGTAGSTVSGHQKRRARTERVVLDTTRELLADSGFSSLTVERVAERSGVAKSTIYRRYRSRNDLAMAVLLDMLGDVSTLPYVKDTQAELTRLVGRTVELMSGTLLGRIMQGLVSEVAVDVELAGTYRATVVGKRVREVTALVERGVERGELRDGLDPELVTDLLLGPIYYRLFLSGEPLDEAFGRQLVASLYPAFAKKPEA